MKYTTAILLSFCFSARSFSQGIDNENFVITHGPWLQNLSPTGITVIWTTNRPAVPGVNITGPDGNNRFVRNSHDGIIDGGGLLHKVRIDGLKSGMTYRYSINSVQILKYQAYRIYYGDTLSGRTENFATPSPGAEKVSFTVFNDVHELSGKMASYIKHSNAANRDFYFFNGDMVNYLQQSNQLFTGFIDTAVFYFAAGKPFYYVRGNHETRGYESRELKSYFDFKDDRFYYSFDWGPVHFIVLDAGEDKPDNNRYYYGLADYDSYRLKELEWLKEELKSEAFRKAKHRIVMVHMPVIKAEKLNQAMTFMTEYYGPLFQSAGIDLLISAHTHRNAFFEKDKSGFGYPVLVNSNNSFVEVEADRNGINAIVKDTEGKTLFTYNIK